MDHIPDHIARSKAEAPAAVILGTRDVFFCGRPVYFGEPRFCSVGCADDRLRHEFARGYIKGVGD